eukprot:scaffold1850_cov170-Amphora_coffeaeformis.AAC.2
MKTPKTKTPSGSGSHPFDQTICQKRPACRGLAEYFEKNGFEVDEEYDNLIAEQKGNLSTAITKSARKAQQQKTAYEEYSIADTLPGDSEGNMSPNDDDAGAKSTSTTGRPSLFGRIFGRKSSPKESPSPKMSVTFADSPLKGTDFPWRYVPPSELKNVMEGYSSADFSQPDALEMLKGAKGYSLILPGRRAGINKKPLAKIAAHVFGIDIKVLLAYTKELLVQFVLEKVGDDDEEKN